MTVWPSVEKVMKDIRRLGLGRKHVLMRSSTWPRLKMKPVCSQEEGACQFLFSLHQRFCFWVHFPNLEVSLTLMKDCRCPSEGSLWRHAAFLEECTRMASWSNLIPLTPSKVFFSLLNTHTHTHAHTCTCILHTSNTYAFFHEGLLTGFSSSIKFFVLLLLPSLFYILLCFIPTHLREIILLFSSYSYTSLQFFSLDSVFWSIDT